MGKRASQFARRKNDAYDTPAEAVEALLPHLPDLSTYIEPCAGNGALIAALRPAGHICVGAIDIEPRGPNVRQGDARQTQISAGADYFITNPPWTRDLLHPIIVNLSAMLPTWLLFDADWMHTRQAAPYLGLCRKIVSVGRVKWIPDSPFTGKDNAAWYLFDANDGAAAYFIGRDARESDTRRMAETALAGSGRSPSGAVPPKSGIRPDLKSILHESPDEL